MSRNPLERASSLAELLAWHDEDFVRCAYVTMLGRRPDEVGEWHYVEQVRQGKARLQVLSELRRSLEGQRHDPGIAGLDRALKRAAFIRLPVVGLLFSLFRRGVDLDDRRAREHRAQLNAATLERYTMHGIQLRLQGIEWALVQQVQTGRSAPDPIKTAAIGKSSNPASQPDQPIAALSHHEIKSPLARFFAAEAR
jgi:hypothetical protein